MNDATENDTPNLTDLASPDESENSNLRDLAARASAKAKGVAKAIEDNVAHLGETVSTIAATASDRARDVGVQAKQQYDVAAARVDPFVREQPYAALGIAAAVGLLAGLLFAGRGSKVVYLKVRRD